MPDFCIWAPDCMDFSQAYKVLTTGQHKLTAAASATLRYCHYHGGD